MSVTTPYPLLPTPFPSGLLLVDKPAGITSHDVVSRVQRTICPEKVTRKNRSQYRVGHAGTLDPFATGLLIVGINKGTKALTGLVGLDKMYEAVAKLGATSTTDDLEGKITNSKPVSAPTVEEIEKALDRFRGGYLQTSPAFSAKKINGKKMYELARKGKTEGIELPKKNIRITELRVISYQWPELAFTVSCSSGTYIRSLARDIGEALGCGGYLTALRRTHIGSFDVSDAIPLAALTTEMIEKHLLPIKND